MGFADRVRHAWQAIAHIDAQARDERGRFITEKAPARKTAALPSILSPYPRVQTALPRPTAANLRRFAETPVVRRAINLVKDRIASMDWQIRIRRGYDAADIPDADAPPQRAAPRPRRAQPGRQLSHPLRTGARRPARRRLRRHRDDRHRRRRAALQALRGRRRGHPGRPQVGRRPRRAALRLRHRPLWSRRNHPAARQRTPLPAPEPAHLVGLRPGQGRGRLRIHRAASSAPTATPASSPRTPSPSTPCGSTRPPPSSTTASSAGGRTRSKAPAASPSSAPRRSPRSCASPTEPPPISASNGRSSASA